MKARYCLILAAALAWAGTSIALRAADAAPKTKVLLLTGDDVSPAHNWYEVSQATRSILLDSKKFEVKVCEDAGILDSAAALKTYDLVYMVMYNAKTPPISDQAKENLLNFVKGGKGFVVTHLSSASWKEWPEFKALCGRVWVMGSSGHGPRNPFKAKVVKPDDPIVQGLSTFDVDDELYAKLQGDAPIKVLVEADSDWSKKTEPLVFTLGYGQGRVFHHTFGHDGKALANEAIRTIVVRGCQWAATGKVD